MAKKKAPMVILKKPSKSMENRRIQSRAMAARQYRATLLDKMERFSELPLTTQILIVGGTLAGIGLIGYLVYLYMTGEEYGEREERGEEYE